MIAVRLLAVIAVMAAVQTGTSDQAKAGVLRRHASLSGGACCDPCCQVCCAPPKTICVTACNPCTCCPVKIKLCVPACCDGCPAVSSRRTLIGAGLVRYDWCCGFSAIVRFNRCGGYRVIYRG